MGRTYRGSEKEKLKEKYRIEREKRNKRHLEEDERVRKDDEKTEKRRRFYDDGLCFE